MKKNKFTETLKGKGYYVLLFVGVLAIAAVALIGTRMTNRNEGGNFVDLNEPNNNIAAGDNDNQLAQGDSSQIVNNIQNNGNDANTNEPASQSTLNNDSLLEYDVFTEAEENGIVLEDPTDVAQAEQADAIETAGKTVQAESVPITLNFKEDDGLLWPVLGNVIMNYSMDHTIYFATLMQFKCNPAIIIDAEVGTEVKAAATGLVTSIENDAETGLTIITDIGNGYSLVYGQLKNVSLKVGDKIQEGSIIGNVAEPTKYYIVEGSNLYFQVLQDDKTVNPMLLLR